MKRETIVVADCACHRHDRKCMGSDSSRHHHGNRIGVEYRQHVGNNVSALANIGVFHSNAVCNRRIRS